MPHIIIISCIFTFLIVNVKSHCDPDTLTPHIYFMYFPGPTVNDYKTFSFENATLILEESTFDVTVPTIFYFHGWTENPLLIDSHPNSSPAMLVPPLLLQHVNIIVVAYGLVAQKWTNETLITPVTLLASYAASVFNVTCMSQPLQNFFNGFFSQCNCLSNTQFIGLSLGGQLAGLVAKGLDSKLPRIVGLDPAGPLFTIGPNLQATDALFVEVIHSDAGGYGYPLPCGTADFWPNKGIRIQPGCSSLTPDSICSHVASLKYFINSISNPSAYPVDGEETMGYWTTSKATGNYYFQTS